MSEYREGTEPHWYEDVRCWRGRVIFRLCPHYGWVSLARIGAIEKGQGHGSAALDWLCALADRHEVRLAGVAEPFGHRVGTKPAMTTKELVAWYRRHGFTVTKGFYIDREPLSQEPITMAYCAQTSI